MKNVEKVLDAVMRFLMAIAMLTLLVFGTWQIFTRWVLGNPSTFTDELLRYVLIIAGFIGSAYCFYRDEHLALTLITDKAILKHMCGRIVTLKNQGVYNGGYEVVKLAVNGRP